MECMTRKTSRNIVISLLFKINVNAQFIPSVIKIQRKIHKYDILESSLLMWIFPPLPNAMTEGEGGWYWRRRRSWGGGRLPSTGTFTTTLRPYVGDLPGKQGGGGGMGGNMNLSTHD